MANSAEYILISIPNKRLPDDPAAKSSTYSELKGLLGDLAEVRKFQLPALRTGTLEKLLQAADNLSKMDSSVEQVIRKIERQLGELDGSSSLHSLKVEEQSVTQYLESFRWNSAKYPVGRHIEELYKTIVQHSSKLEEELKESAAYLQERKTVYIAAQRRKEGNFTVVDLNNVLSDELLQMKAGKSFGETEYLQDVVIIVPKALEDKFLKEYEDLASEMVGYGEAGNRDSVKGSPVVPGSAVKVAEDKEGFRLYIVTILKGFFDDLKRACLGNRFIVREHTFGQRNSSKEVKEEFGDIAVSPDILGDFKEAEYQLRQWCRAHYGEAFVSWIHIKAIRLFVESCLRYGIPANFTAVLVMKSKKTENLIRERLMKEYKALDSSGLMQLARDETGVGAALDEQVFPYVSLQVSAYGPKD